MTEHRPCAAMLDHIGRRYPGVRGDDADIARPDIQRQQRQVKGAGAIAHCNRMFHPYPLRDGTLEARNPRSLHEESRCHCFAYCKQVILFDGWDGQTNHRPAYAGSI